MDMGIMAIAMTVTPLDFTATGRDAIRTRALAMRHAERTVFADLDLNLASGTMVGLIGPNGAGKTTLLNLLMGLMAPTAGEVWVLGRSLGGYRRRTLAQAMTLVPQEQTTGFAFRVEDIVAMGRNPHLGRFQVAGAKDLAQIRLAMAQTRLTDLAHRTLDTLSGGERQRTAIARAIAQETPIVLLDEVTANLDLCHQLEVLTLARELAEAGRLVVAAIHDLNLAARFCHRLVLLAEGRIQADGPPRGVLTTAHLRRYFGVEAWISDLPAGPGLQITPRYSAA